MTASPEDVEREVRRLARKLEAKTDELAELFHDAAEAEVAYRVEYAKALLVADAKTVAEREAAATVYCEKLLWDRKTKEAVADAAREAARSLRDQISAVQSVGAMVRSQMELAR
jgi:hypothetical protein